MSAPAPDSLDVRIIQSFVRFVRRRFTLLVSTGSVLIVAGIIAWGIYTVPTNQTGALFRFGALIDDSVETGIHFRLPSPIDKVTLMNTTEMRRYVISDKPGRTVDMVTGDENLIEIDIAVQYQIQDYGNYLTGAEDWESITALAIEASLSEQVARMTVDSVLTVGKNQIQVNLRKQLQETLDIYGDGITVVSTRIVSISPPLEAADSFRGVSDARSERARQISEARSRSNRTLSNARGEVEQILMQAKSDAEERIKKAQGDAARFSDILAEYQGKKTVTRKELYFSKVSSALKQAKTILLDPAQPVDINLSEKSSTSPASQP
jgi:modulator of FtsH protease HflK